MSASLSGFFDIRGLRRRWVDEFYDYDVDLFGNCSAGTVDSYRTEYLLLYFMYCIWTNEIICYHYHLGTKKTYEGFESEAARYVAARCDS